jgi:U3 small nucleolar RNA-associated protein 5
MVSSAVNDRMVHVWSLDTDRPDVDPLASFSLQGDPVHVDISEPTSRGQNVLMTVVTAQGALEVFEQQFNGRQRKPTCAKVTLHVGGSDSQAVPHMSPVLAAKLLSDEDHTFLFVHGHAPDLTFERKSLSECDESVVYVVSDSLVNNNNNNMVTRSKRRTSERSKDKHVTDDPSTPVSKGQKRKNNGEATLEEKLEVLKMVMTSQLSRHKLMEKSSSQLLLQGLQSQDTAILDNVLCHEALINQTVSQLPSHAVAPLLEELNKRIRLGGPKTKCYLAWMKEVLAYHKSYLSSHPQCEQLFEPLQPVLEQRCVLQQSLCRLRGRLDLLLAQARLQDEESSETTRLYHDESEDDIFEDEVDETTPSYPTKMWEELSHVSDEDDDDDIDEDEQEYAGELPSDASEDD